MSAFFVPFSGAPEPITLMPCSAKYLSAAGCQGIDEFAAQTLELQKEVDELARKHERPLLIPPSLKTP